MFIHGDLMIYGYELVRKNNGREEENLDQNLMTSFIDIIRDKIPRNMSVYIVTLVRKYYGGSYLICSGKDEHVKELCELAVATLETLSRGKIRSKKLRDGEIRDIILLNRKQMGEVPELHALYADIIDPGEISYSIKTTNNVVERDSILIGETSRSKIKTPYSIPLRDLIRHVAIFGSTGSGKTTTAATLAYRAHEKNAVVYILDWHGEYSRILRDSAEEYKIRTMSSMRRLPVFKDPEQLLEVLEAVFDLTPAQSYILSRVLRRMKNFEIDFRRIYEEISMFPEEARWVSESKLSLLRRFETFIDEEEYEADDTLSILEDGKERIITIDLSQIDRTSMRSLASLLIIKSIAYINSRKDISRKDLMKIVVVDEAHHVFRRHEGSNVIRDTLAEIRKYNVGMILVTQSPSSIGEDILKNTNTKIIHSIRSDMDKKILRESTSLPKEFEDLMPLLDVGEAIVVSASNSYPMIVRVIPITNSS
ncbi:MAG: ATP-binding protein [Sulfolobales archaeon]|jgi:DNA helicase HerA-like ATPase